MVVTYLLLFLSALQFFLFLRVVWSWFPSIPKGSFYGFLSDLTEPLLDVVRKIPHRWGMIDVSPILAFFLIDFLRMVIASLVG